MVFLYPLKTSENQKMFDIFRSHKKISSKKGFNAKVFLMFSEGIKLEQWIVICELLLGMHVLIILNYNHHIWINVFFPFMNGLMMLSFEQNIDQWAKYSRMDQVQFFKGCLPQILHSPFLNALSHLSEGKYLLNLFLPHVIFLYPQKHQKTLQFYDVFWEYRNVLKQ